MKSILTGFIFVLVTNFAHADGAVGALKSVLALGVHEGKNINGACSVIVQDVNFPRMAYNVSVLESTKTSSKLIDDEATYAQKLSKKCFFQSDRTYIHGESGDYSEKYLRTYLNKDNTLHVMIGNVIVIENNLDESIAECDIAL